MNETGWFLPEIDIYDLNYHEASVSRMERPVSTVCTHCGKKQPVQALEVFSWLDREKEQRGYVWVCSACGSRHAVKAEVRKTGVPDRNKKKKSGSSPVLLLLLIALLMLVSLLIGLLWFMQGQSGSKQPASSSPSSHTTTDPVLEDEAEVYDDGETLVISETMQGIGNSYINISEGGLMLVLGDWIYYTNPADHYYIYRMDLNLENSELICAIPSYYLNYWDGVIYFSGSEDGRQQYRMNPDGTGLEMINARRVYEGKIVNGYLYYDDIDEDYTLYRSRLDGTDETFISAGIVFYTIITDDSIYYIDTSDDRYCYRMDLDGSDKEVFISEPCRDMSILDGTLYVALKEGGIWSVDLSDNTSIKLSDLNASCLIAHSDGWIYFCNKDKDNRLYKMTLDGEDLTKLTEDPVEFVNVYSNLISYQNRDTKDFYWCLTDSSHRTVIR